MAAPPVLYVHASAEGAAFVVRADGSQAWVTAAQLDADLEAIAAAEGMILVSLEGGAEAPPPAHAVHRRLIGSSRPVRRLPEEHPAVTPLPQGVTRLMAFCHAGRADLVADLLERGASVDVIDQEGTTPLMYASNSGALEVVKLLIGHGAEVNATDHDGATALMYAARNGHLEVVRALLVAGADPAMESAAGTALDEALDFDQRAVADLLRRIAPR